MNEVKLQEGHPVDENLRPLKVGGKSTALETAQHGNGARVNGDLDVTGKFNIKNNGNITLDAGGGDITVFQADLTIPLNKKVIFGAAEEYISGDGNHLTITSGVNLNIDADGHVEFDGCGVGFDLETPTYDASDTDVNFINGNKQFVTFGAGNITDLNLVFPKISGNFLLMLKQDGTGSRLVTNYKVWDRATSSAAGGSATVKFAGGSNPTLTTDANHVDIISFFYDGDNEIAYGVATLDFQF